MAKEYENSDKEVARTEEINAQLLAALEDIREQMEDMREQMERNFMSQFAEIKRKITDLETAQAGFRALTQGQACYRPRSEARVQTGESLIHPVQAWRRRPGY